MKAALPAKLPRAPPWQQEGVLEQGAQVSKGAQEEGEERRQSPRQDHLQRATLAPPRPSLARGVVVASVQHPLAEAARAPS